MKKLIKNFSDSNPERFNKDFILSRDDESIIHYIEGIFKSLEVLHEIEVLDIKLETDEATFGPIVSQHQYFKSIEPTRLNKIHYKVKITPSNNVVRKILVDENDGPDLVIESSKNDEASVIVEQDLFINKLIDNTFYINEGIRYFLIYQIVDNATYGTGNSVSLKSLLMPITVSKREDILVSSYFDSTKTYKLPTYEVLLFSKRISPIFYVLGKYALNSLVEAFPDDSDEDIIIKRQQFKDPSLIEKFNKFFGVDFKFSDDALELVEEGRTIFSIKDKANKGVFLSCSTQDLESGDKNLLSVLGSLLNSRIDGKKKKLVFTYDDLITPDFWINKISAFFTKNSDGIKKFEKTKTMLISLERLIDDGTRKVLKLKQGDNTLSVLRYMIRNFEDLSKSDSQDLDKKRIRLYEYQLYPLRKYFSDQIYRVLNSSTRSLSVLEKIFSSLNPMYIIKKTVVNELLRYYNSTNEINLYGALLKYTFRGPQAINKMATDRQRDLHPSYTGRLSLVASSVSDPGISGTLVPFVEVYGDGFFKDQEGDGDERKN